jgi:hypothetical protein
MTDEFWEPAWSVLEDAQLPRTKQGIRMMNWTPEVVVVPVADVDRAKTFYAERLGFNVDHDTKVSEGKRIVQLTPPGSAGRLSWVKGSSREVSEIQVVGESPRPQPDPLDNVGFVFFSDPDGNGWAVQQISARG